MCRQGTFSLRQSRGTRFIKMQSLQGSGFLALPWFMQVGESSKMNCGLHCALGECAYPPSSRKSSSAFNTFKRSRSSLAIGVSLSPLQRELRANPPAAAESVLELKRHGYDQLHCNRLVVQVRCCSYLHCRVVTPSAATNLASSRGISYQAKID